MSAWLEAAIIASRNKPHLRGSPGEAHVDVAARLRGVCGQTCGIASRPSGGPEVPNLTNSKQGNRPARLDGAKLFKRTKSMARSISQVYTFLRG